MKKATMSILSVGLFSFLVMPTADASSLSQEVLDEIDVLEEKYGVEITVDEEGSSVSTFSDADTDEALSDLQEFEENLKIVEAISSEDIVHEINITDEDVTVGDDIFSIMSGNSSKSQIFNFNFTEFDIDPVAMQQVWRFDFGWEQGPPAAGRIFTSISNITTSIQGLSEPIAWDHDRSRRESWANVGGAAQGGANLRSFGDWRVTGSISGFPVGATVADEWTARVTAN